MNTIQIDSTKNLLAVIEGMLSDASFEESTLDAWSSICGNYKCVLGQYIFTYRKDLINDITCLVPKAFVENFSVICEEFDFFAEFGFSENYNEKGEFYNRSITGTSACGSLLSRYHYVKEQLINAGAL